MSSARVLVVGSVNVDLVVRVPRLPGPGETVLGGTFERHGGGKSANQAVAAARAGASTLLVAAVGQDEAGGSALQELASAGVDVSRCLRLPDVATGIALIVVDPAGANQIAVAPGANAALRADFVQAALRDVTTTPHDVLLLTFEVGEDAVLAAARWAGRRGIRLIVNPAPARRIDPGLLACRPMLVPNESEAAYLAGHREPGQAARAMQAGSGAPVVVTLGERGALLYQDGVATPVPGHAVETVDTTGAGDALCGILAAELARGLALLPALERAVAGSALATTLAGARDGMPTRERIDALLGSPSGEGLHHRPL